MKTTLVTKLAVAGLATLSLVACRKTTFEGSGKITSQLDVNLKPARKPKVVSIPKGDYNIRTVIASRKITFSMASTQGMYEFVAKTPKVLKKEGAFNDFAASAAELGQTFGLEGKHSSVSKDGKEYTRSETCVYDTYSHEVCHPGYHTPPQTHCTPDREECHKVPDTSHDGYDVVCHTVPGSCWTDGGDWVPGYCETQTEYIYGSRSATGFDRTTNTTLAVKLLSPASDKLGAFSFPVSENTQFIEKSGTACVR